MLAVDVLSPRTKQYSLFPSPRHAMTMIFKNKEFDLGVASTPMS